MTVDNFVGSLVEMAKAHERLPQIEHELSDARVSIDAQAATIQRLELRLIERANEIAELHSRIRELEVSRDEAQFQALEADDRTSRALDFIKATFGNAGSLIQALDPPKALPPAPDVSVQAVPEAPTAQPEVRPEFPVAGDPSQDTSQWGGAPAEAPPPSRPDIGSGNYQTDPAQPAPEVAPMPDPIGAHTPSSNSSLVGASSASDAEPTSIDQPAAPPPDAPLEAGPYVGKCYSEVVASGHWPTRDQWEAGGGTVDNWFA